MFIKTFPVGAFQCNCSIIADEASGEAIIVDPGDEADRIVAEVKALEFDVKFIVHTHAHIDHIGATKTVNQNLGGKICLHKDDTPLYENMAMQAQMLGVDMDCDVLPITQFIETGDVLECQGGLNTKVIHTPGHTPGSVCFFIDDFISTESSSDRKPLLLTGDTLFLSSIGRTDLWGGDHKQILASIKERLLVLPPDTFVLPGHGQSTTIGHEAKGNPFLK